MAEHYDIHTYKRVTTEHIDEQFNKFMDIINTVFSGERREKLLNMYEFLGTRLLTAPASGKVGHHCAYEGGYLDHVLNVISAARIVTDVYRKIGGTIDYTLEECVFAAMHHDLGKLGDFNGPYYEREPDKYWIERGHTYKRVEGTQVSTVYDKTILLLATFGVTFSQKELIGIRMADGVFDPANDSYFKANGLFPHKTALGYVIHWADWMSTNAEKDEQRKLMGMD